MNVYANMEWMEKLTFCKASFESLGYVSQSSKYFENYAKELDELEHQDVISIVFRETAREDGLLWFWYKPMLECGYVPAGKMICDDLPNEDSRVRYIMARPKDTKVIVYQENVATTTSTATVTNLPIA